MRVLAVEGKKNSEALLSRMTLDRLSSPSSDFSLSPPNANNLKPRPSHHLVKMEDIEDA